jgi:tRNA-dependent cyclodipeptide synthase
MTNAEVLGEPIKKSKVTPAGACWRTNAKAFYTASVCLDGKPIDDVAAAYKWIISRRDINFILVGDALNRITLQIRDGLSKHEAEQRAELESQLFVRRLISSINDKSATIRKTSFLFSSAEFVKCLDEIRSSYNACKDFQSSVTSDAKLYVDRQQKKAKLALDYNQSIELSIQYLKEEIAVYLMLAKEDYLVDFYLGQEIPTLAKIINGKLPNAPKPLKARINIALQKRQRSAAVACKTQMQIKKAA